MNTLEEIYSHRYSQDTDILKKALSKSLKKHNKIDLKNFKLKPLAVFVALYLNRRY